MERDLVINGIRIGEYDFNPDGVIDEIKEKCIECGMNYVAFSVGTKVKPDISYFEKWAEFLKANSIYFTFTQAPQTTLGFDANTALRMKEIAGDYYLGNIVTEIGSAYCCKGNAYGGTGEDALDAPVKCMESGKEVLVNAVRRYIDRASLDNSIAATTIEATGLVPYVAECSESFPILETMCGNPEIMLPIIRGTARAIDRRFFATYIAHEWYGGTRNFDTLKRKRLKMVYDYSYMSGSGLFVLESGDLFLHSHDALNYRKKQVDDSEVCENYRQVIKDFAHFAKDDVRPKGGPRVKLAFVQGNLDGYSPWRGGSSLWNQWDKKEYGYGEAEFVWRILDDVSAKRGWADTHNFGDEDLSSAPAYGMYDIISATASAEAMKKYDYLIFLGWNTMTDEIYENLKDFVSCGGKLFMTAAHLNTSKCRSGEINLVRGGDVAELFGCRLDAENKYNVNDGYRFNESVVPGVLYPRSRDFDPLFSEGFASFAKAEITSGVCTAFLTQNFVYSEADFKNKPALIENKCGEGYAMLLTGLDYPSGQLYAVYRTVVRELMQASHREADIKVACSDKVRFSVYEGDKMYLLNTDFDCKSYAKITAGDKVTELLLEPCEFRVIESVR